MKSKSNLLKRTVALGLASAMTVVTCVAQMPQKIDAATSNQGVTKEENVYVIGDAEGTVSQVIVSDWLKNEENSSVITDKTNLTEVQNVKGDETFTTNGDELTWNAGGNDIFYRGNSSQDLPVGMTISYNLDGTDVKPADIKGKSGKLIVTVNYTNETAQTSGEYIPFIMLTGMMLDSDHYSNVKVENGKFISDGDKNIVIGYGIPGIEDQIDLDIDAMNSVKVTADVTDFDSLITMSVATNEIFNLDKLDTSKVDDMKDGVETLRDAMNTLNDKTGDFVEGMDKLNTKSSALVTGTKKLSDGAKKFSVNMGTLNTQVKQIGTKLKSVTKQMKQLVKGAKDLSKGAKDAKAGTKAMSEAINTLSTGLSGLNKKFPLLVAGVKSVQDGCTKVSGLLANLEVGSQGVEQYLAKEKQLNAKDKTDLMTLMAKAQTIADPTLKKEVTDLITTLLVSNGTQTQVISGAAVTAQKVTAGTTGIKSGVDTLEGAISDKKSGLLAGMTTAQGGVSDLSTGASKLYTKSKELDAGMKKINDGAAQLYTSVSGSMPKITKMIAKVPQLTKGVQALYDASKTLASGTKELNTKSKTLVSGIGKLDTASGKLKDGISEIKDGTDKLYDGVKKVVDALDQVTESKNYDTFSGLGEGMTGKVRFIFKTE